MRDMSNMARIRRENHHRIDSGGLFAAQSATTAIAARIVSPKPAMVTCVL